ncbi:isoprenyl transferase [Alkaliphilus peptidifermentans]|uniref:Isoprenyl transferase n=1 Tax=Alkaliphilus peptidifermentans DSM 18978 TaxID=1120976 RepID=A0A1G5DDP9_9FIRM|nr:isoprenyl transferase [Alkaliphilus peptidifermentans]SCY12883.1 Undecaprenyl pyrophosphate synthetase [Alkaliphilus peptidifermentans DSM 18978]
MIEVNKLINLFKKPAKKRKINKIDDTRIPSHIAIIMDGNGRWAKARQLPRTFGHKAGVEALRDVIKTASNIGVKYLTLYAFSTENWSRPQDEVSALMQLLVDYLKKEVGELHSNNVRINTIGDIEGLPRIAKIEVKNAKALTKSNSGLCVNIALNYGGRDEIIRGIKKLYKDVEDGLSIENLQVEEFAGYLDTTNIPDPDLLIRTSGEYRFSNFLLWQSAYTELWFTETYWPDFRGEDLIGAIVDYQNRTRRFGGI